MSYDYLFKLIFIGDRKVGKTALVNRIINKRFVSRYDSTIGVDFGTKSNIINEYRIKSHIWDTAGDIKFSSIITNYYKGIAGVAIVFDVTRRSSFKKADFWRQEFEQNKDHDLKISTILIGNKTDGKRTVSEKEGRKYADDHGMLYIETSAKNDQNTNESFELLLKDICENMNTDDLGAGIRRHFSYGKIKKKPDNNSWCWCC